MFSVNNMPCYDENYYWNSLESFEVSEKLAEFVHKSSCTVDDQFPFIINLFSPVRYRCFYMF
jgi:hypothetical protein